MAATIWKGVIRVGEEAVPVKLHSAVKDRTIRFRLLDEPEGDPVEQRMVNPRSGKPVPYEKIRRGIETESGEIVMLDEKELETLTPKESRDIEIVRVVPREAIDHRWYLRPYWLAPEGESPDYFALAKALEEEEREGVARWTMRKKQYQGALHARDGYLMLITLRHASEVVSAAELEGPTGRELDPREMKMAAQLVEALSGEFEPARYEDEYRNRVAELIEAKASGKRLRLEPKRERKKAASLASALEQSLKQARKERSVA
ncbi:MAG TPA: Ku protein [Gemmatimonadota bacterium]|jgi:DNA end-binding protein Ku